MIRIKGLSILMTLMAISVAAPAHADGDSADQPESSADILARSEAQDWQKIDPENTLYIELERGRVIVALSSVLAQTHVAQIKLLAREGFYDGLSFYRVIEGFVAQGGDPFNERDIKNASARLGAQFDEPVRDELSIYRLKDITGFADQVGFVDSLPVGLDTKDGKIWHLHCTGALAFGRNDERNSASTEIYITLQPQRYLDRNLTVVGRVVSGMEHIQALQRVSPPQSKTDDLGETITSVRVASDLPAEAQTPLEILSSSSALFDAYVEARRNRPEAFFYHRPDHLDVCQLPIPVRTPTP